jgi:hypothetical protein
MDDKRRIALPRWALVVLLVLAVVGVGYVSAVITRRGAENSAAAELAVRWDKLYVRARDEHSREILSRIDAEHILYTSGGPRGQQDVLWPDGGAAPSLNKEDVAYVRIERGRVTWPFVVQVPRVAVFGNLGAFGDVCYYVSFFGLCFRVYRHVMWVS